MECGLSQGQLAGMEISRSYISLIERGLANPAPQVLEIIARRLGKPVTYFLEANDLMHSVGWHLVDSADHALARKDLQMALKHAEMALKVCWSIDDDPLRERVLTVMLKAQYDLGNIVEAIDTLDQLIGLYSKVDNRNELFRAMAKMGNCYFRLEDFDRALRWYERAIALGSHLKTLDDELVQTSTYLASTQFRLGNLSAAEATYRTALERTNRTVNPWRWGTVAMSPTARDPK